jgi:2-polyprenyl-3-methyl-5-hydroxy-6-metoxy-1,4-benzoquinol methylase
MALDFARMNAELNGVTVAEWGELDWRNPPTDRRYDRVFGADILYELVHHAPILSCVKQLLAPNGVALISDPHRGVADRIADMAREEGFDVRIMSGEAPNHLGQTIRGRVFELRIPDKSAT